MGVEPTHYRGTTAESQACFLLLPSSFFHLDIGMTIPSEVVDLLICCAGVDPEKGPKLGALISQGVVWNLVIEQGHRHDILPLLYWSLKTHCPDKVPDPIMKKLREFFQAKARKNLFAIS